MKHIIINRCNDCPYCLIQSEPNMDWGICELGGNWNGELILDLDGILKSCPLPDYNEAKDEKVPS